jgi:dihydroneopterin aldolase
LDLEISVNLKPAGASDAIADTVDYHAVAKRLMAFVSESQFHLLESLADQAARVVITEFGAERIRLAVNKAGAIRGATSVGVIIERTRADYA